MLVIGRALMSAPRVILLDEPSLGLAPMLVEEIFEIVSRLNREQQLTVLLVEQNATLALAIAEHGYEMAKETMSAPARRRYHESWLRELIELAWRRAPGVRRRLEAAGLTPGDLRDPDAHARLPVLKKSQMPDLQQADPPFGGFCTRPLSELRRIFRSPGPIYEPMGPEAGGFHAETGYYAGGFRPGDVVLQTFAYHLVPAGH